LWWCLAAFLETRFGPRRLGKAGGGRLPDRVHAEPGKYDVLLFSIGDWEWRYQRPQHLAVQWSRKGHRVFFIGPHVRPNRGPSCALRSCLPYTVRLVADRVLEVCLSGPQEIRPLDARPLPADVDELLAAIEALRSEFGIQCAISFLEYPFWRSLAAELKRRHGWGIVYDCIDRLYGVFPRSHSMLSDECQLVREADLVVTTARLLEQEWSGHAQRMCLVPNAADVEHFCRRPNVAPPLEVRSDSPVIGYVGAIRPWFDVDLLHGVASRRPEWTFVIIGSGDQMTTKLRTLPNVRLVGELPYSELPACVHAFDVCLVPFRLLPVIAATDPVKVYEYLAAGKPVVATDLAELRQHADLLYIAQDCEGFERAIAQALHEDCDCKRFRRQRFARDNSWEVRARVLDRAIRAIVDPIGEGSTTRAAVSAREVKAPHVSQLHPAAVRAPLPGSDRSRWDRSLTVLGSGFSPSCVVLLDEEPIETAFVSPTELNGRVPRMLYQQPGCQMVSVVDRVSWRNSNRRVFMVEPP